MAFPSFDMQSIEHFHSALLEVEGIVLNVILFVQMCIKHFKK